MSDETSRWLNTQTLIGFTDKRGKAWHYRQSAQGAEPNHYAGPIPVADVERRLFNWSAVIGEAWSKTDAFGLRQDESQITLNASDNGDVLGHHSPGYGPHQYGEWLLGSVATILGDELAIGSAGLLRGRRQAWVQVEVPENVEATEGVVFRPNLLACTSHDGSLATTFRRTVTNVVCDNTLSAALLEPTDEVRVRHSRNSQLLLPDARAALRIVDQMSDNFRAQVAALVDTKVSDPMWREFLDAHVSIPDKQKSAALKKRAELVSLWRTDPRVAPWTGTAWGVLQAVNTYAHHIQGERAEVGRPERNMRRAVKGETDTLDRATLATLNAVMAHA